MDKKSAAKSINKSDLFAQLAEQAEVSKADVKKYYEAMTEVILKNLGKKGPGVLTLPGLFKLTTVRKPAVKGGQPVLNRFTGEMTTTKDKPASVKVKARSLKQLNGSIK